MNNNFGISGDSLKWFDSYLNNREQQCIVDGQICPKKIICGVPQGSILGPLLFLLYINHIPKCLHNTIPSLYADDTVIHASSNDSSELVSKLNRDLNGLSNWIAKNKLQIHPTKSKPMFVGSSYNIKNKICNQLFLINNIPFP